MSIHINKYEIELTSNCNAECPICARTILGMPLAGNYTLTLDDIKNFFPTRDLIEGIEFGMCGSLGDPIMAPDCLEICRYLADNGGKVTMSTNGGYRTEAWWRELATIDNMFVGFAVDGYRETNHIYRVNVKWELVERNMRAYTSAGGRGRWKFVVFAHNEHEVEPAKALAEELGLKFAVRTGGRNEFSVGQTHTPRRAESVILNTGKKYKHTGDVTEHKKVIEHIFKKDIKKIQSAIPSITCRHLQEGDAYIGSDKTLWHCCHLYSEYAYGSLDLYKGVDPDWNNLEMHSISEILAHPNFTDIKKMWNPEHDRYTPDCLKTCGTAGAYLDKNQDL